jgi:hypothetical protein
MAPFTERDEPQDPHESRGPLACVDMNGSAALPDSTQCCSSTGMLLVCYWYATGMLPG